MPDALLPARRKQGVRLKANSPNMREHNLAFTDIETTGFEVLRHEIIEIGCVIATPELEVTGEFEFKIKPERLEEADPAALKINHYNEADWADALTLKDAIEVFSEKMKDCVMVGQNVSFDSGFLECAFAKLGIKNSMHYHKLDTMSMAWALLRERSGLNRFSLRELCQHFGIKNERAHSALSDARATFEVYKKMMEL